MLTYRLIIILSEEPIFSLCLYVYVLHFLFKIQYGFLSKYEDANYGTERSDDKFFPDADISDAQREHTYLFCGEVYGKLSIQKCFYLIWTVLISGDLEIDFCVGYVCMVWCDRPAAFMHLYKPHTI